MAECLVFLVGEGASEIGDLAGHPVWNEGEEGFLQPLVRRVAAEVGVRVRFRGRKIASLPKAPRKGNIRKAKRRWSHQAALLAEQASADLLVLLHDVDKTTGRRRGPVEARRLMEALEVEVREGLDAAKISIPVIVGLPLRMIEAWALGDPEAVHEESEGEDDARRETAPAPEGLWGNEEDPASRHPKRVLQRALGRQPTREDFAALAAAADLEILADRCPRSFGPFLDALRRQAQECGDRE